MIILIMMKMGIIMMIRVVDVAVAEKITPVEHFSEVHHSGCIMST